MGRITEAIAIINKEIMLTEMEYKHLFTHLAREDALKLKKIYRKKNIRRIDKINE